MNGKLAVALTLLAGLTLQAARADTLEEVQKRGALRCGLSDRAPGFSLVNEAGRREGFEVDYCDALAAAIFMVPRAANIKSAKDLGGATFCSTQGTTYELNLADWMGTQGLTYKIVNFAD